MSKELTRWKRVVSFTRIYWKKKKEKKRKKEKKTFTCTANKMWSWKLDQDSELGYNGTISDNTKYVRDKCRLIPPFWLCLSPMNATWWNQLIFFKKPVRNKISTDCQTDRGMKQNCYNCLRNVNIAQRRIIFSHCDTDLPPWLGCRHKSQAL